MRDGRKSDNGEIDILVNTIIDRTSYIAKDRSALLLTPLAVCVNLNL
jgi:hypothetical protein